MKLTRHALLLAVAGAFSAPALAAKPAAKEKSVGDEGRHITTSEEYVSHFGLNATISSEGVQRGVILLDAGLDVPDADLRKRILRMQPVVRDALRTGLAEFAYNRYRVGSPPDLDALKRLLQQAIDRAVGKAGATVVLANVLVQQR